MQTNDPSTSLPTGISRQDYLRLAETVLGAILSSGAFDCRQGAWVAKLYPEDPDLPSIYADGSELFTAMAAYMAATGSTTLGGCELPSAMWHTFTTIEAVMPTSHYQTGISCVKLMSGIDDLGGPTEDNPFWASLTAAQREQLRRWMIDNEDWQPVARNMFLFRAIQRYSLYAWGWDDTLAESIADQEKFLDGVTDEGWLYDGPFGINDYSIYSVFGAMLNARLNAARVRHGDAPVHPGQSSAFVEAMVRYLSYAAGRGQEPMPWSRSNGLYGLGAWIGLPEQALAQEKMPGIQPGMLKRVARLYFLWLKTAWYDGTYFNPYLDPTGVEPYENAFNGNGQVLIALLEAYLVASDTDLTVESPLPVERIDYDLTFLFGDTADASYGVRIVTVPGDGGPSVEIQKPAYRTESK